MMKSRSKGETSIGISLIKAEFHYCESSNIARCVSLGTRDSIPSNRYCFGLHQHIFRHYPC